MLPQGTSGTQPQPLPVSASLLQGNHLGEEGDKAKPKAEVHCKKYFQISKPGIISNRHANLKFRICGTRGRCGMVSGPFYFVLHTYDMMGKKIIEKYPFQSKKETFSECWKYFHTISNFSQACFQHKTWTVSLLPIQYQPNMILSLSDQLHLSTLRKNTQKWVSLHTQLRKNQKVSGQHHGTVLYSRPVSAQKLCRPNTALPTAW